MNSIQNLPVLETVKYLFSGRASQSIIQCLMESLKNAKGNIKKLTVKDYTENFEDINEEKSQNS